MWNVECGMGCEGCNSGDFEGSELLELWELWELWELCTALIFLIAPVFLIGPVASVASITRFYLNWRWRKRNMLAKTTARLLHPLMLWFMLGKTIMSHNMPWLWSRETYS